MLGKHSVGNTALLARAQEYALKWRDAVLQSKNSVSVLGCQTSILRLSTIRVNPLNAAT